MKIFISLLLLTWLWGLPIADKTLFIVDGKPYLLSDYVTYLSLKEMKQIKKLPSSADKLEDFINFVVLAAEAESKGYSVADEEIEKEISLLAMQNGMSKEELKNYIEKNLRISFEKFREMRRMYILNNYLISPEIQKISINQDETESYYRQHKEEFTRKAAKVEIIITTKHIKHQGKIPPAEIKKLFPNATTSVVDVTMGYFMRDIENKIFSAQKRELIGPIKSSHGYMYIFVLESARKEYLPISDVKEQIKKILQNNKKEEVIKKEISAAKENHFILKCFGEENGKIDYNQRGSCGNWK